VAIAVSFGLLVRAGGGNLGKNLRQVVVDPPIIFDQIRHFKIL
jgi:hypothetical protein